MQKLVRKSGKSMNGVATNNDVEQSLYDNIVVISVIFLSSFHKYLDMSKIAPKMTHMFCRYG